MKIQNIRISNYRNLDDLEFSLHEKCNFIVGENNLGKSNFLTLLNIIFNSRGFQFSDFKDVTLPIEIQLQLRLDDVELGHFQDLFDTDDYTLINLVVRQNSPDDNVTFHHLESETFISPSVIKCINYVHYDSMRNPVAEISFDKGKGVGKFLRSIISKYLSDNDLEDSEFLDNEKMEELLDSINSKVSKIKSFSDFQISATQDKDVENLLSKVIVLEDSKGNSLTKSGYGVQFLILVTLSLLEKLHAIQQFRGDKGIFESEEDGSKSISLVLGLDEPEIHLHPYMQRSLIKYLGSIVENQNDDFRALVKEIFDIDNFIGQIIVVTHSPNIILNDYRQITRFCSESGVIRSVSGCDLTLSTQLEKHLYMQFPFVKEAFFARCVIFIEGETEFASLPLFGKKMGIDFDDEGICIIQARGPSIPQLLELASNFRIPAVGISDKDDGSFTPSLPNHYLTDARDFEDEVVSLIDKQREAVLRSILTDFIPTGIRTIVQKNALNKHAFKKYGLTRTQYTSDLKLSSIASTDVINLKAFYLTFFCANKSYPLGYLIGTHLEKKDIPTVYKRLIKAAKTMAQNA